MWKTSFRALTTDITVECDDRALYESVRRLTDTYGAPVVEPELVYRFAAADGALFRGAKLLCRGVGPIDLLPIFEFDFYQRVVDCSRGFIVHSGCVSDGVRAVMLAGESGAGKSTLTSALIDRGARYVTDECTAISADGTVLGLARPIGIKGTPATMGATFTRSVYEFRRMDGAIDRQTLLHPADASIERGPTALAAIVLIHHVPARAAVLDRLDATAALDRLWALRRGGGPEAFEVALDVASRVPVHTLSTATVEQACRDVLTLTDLRLG